MITKIILERHGQSIGNRDKIYLGHTDLGLSEKGAIQAELTAKHLASVPITAIYSSDLKRAMSTAEPHAKLRGLTVNSSRELREMYVGDWEGKRTPDLIRDYPEDFVVRRTHRDFVYPGGEAVTDAAKRLNDEICRIARENKGGTVLIVSHSAAIRAFWYYLSGCTEQNMTDKVPFMPNAAYCTLTFDGEKLIPEKYFYAEHLSDIYTDTV